MEQRSREWYQARLGRFTASEIWKLMSEPRSKEAKANGELSETAKTYILDKIAERLTGQSKDFYNDATVWGLEHEEHARNIYRSVTPYEITECTFFPFGEEAGGSPDGVIGDVGIIEIKCPYNTTEHLKHCLITDAEYMRANFKEYYWQIQANLLFSNRDWCHFISFDPRIERGEGFFKIHIDRNPDDVQLITSKISQAIEYMNLFMEKISNNCQLIKEDSMVGDLG